MVPFIQVYRMKCCSCTGNKKLLTLPIHGEDYKYQAFYYAIFFIPLLLSPSYTLMFSSESLPHIIRTYILPLTKENQISHPIKSPTHTK